MNGINPQRDAELSVALFIAIMVFLTLFGAAMLATAVGWPPARP